LLVLDTQSRELILAKDQPEPSDEILKLLARKSIKWTGRKHSANRAGNLKNIPIMADFQLQEMGRTFLFNELAKESGLIDALREAFGEPNASFLLWAAMHQVCEGNALYLFHEWMEDVCGYPCEGTSPASMGRLLQKIGDATPQQREFFIGWLKACGTPKALIHDTTSISTYSNLEMAEVGYNRDGENLPQINLALVVARESRLPLWYRILPGSIPDVASLKVTASLLEEFGLNDFSFTLDRGYFSSGNIAEMLAKKIRFCIGVPMHIKQAKSILSTHWQELRKFKNTFLLKLDPIAHVQCKYAQKQTDGSMKELVAHLYWNVEQSGKMSIHLDRAILELIRLAEAQDFKTTQEATEWLEENTGKYNRFFGVKNAAGKASVLVKSSLMTQAKKLFGVMLLINEDGGLEDNQSDHEEVLADYRSRDIAEKIFDAYKNTQGNGRLKTGKIESVDGRVFLAFLSSILRSLLENKLRKSSERIKIGIPEVLLQLKKIRRIKAAQGSPIALEVPKKSRDLLEALGLRLEDVQPIAPKAARRHYR